MRLSDKKVIIAYGKVLAAQLALDDALVTMSGCNKELQDEITKCYDAVIRLSAMIYNNTPTPTEE